MGIAAIYTTYDQCSPDAFECVEHVKNISTDTTIGELIEWQQNDPCNKGYQRKKMFDTGGFFAIRIVQMD